MTYSERDSGSAVSEGQRNAAREMEALLWLAAGAAWALVALTAWHQTRKSEARRRTFAVSQRLLHQVFPHGIRS